MHVTSQQSIIDNYRELLRLHRSGPAVGQWSSEGQRFRFEKLAQIGDLKNRRILDLGCGLGDLYPFLKERFGHVDYTGVDIVPELVTAAAKQHRDARFICQDLLENDLTEMFDYVLISGMFNNDRPDCTAFLKQMICVAFKHCTVGLAFNFTSRYVNFTSQGMAYYDPSVILAFCIERLTRRIEMRHHYQQCDVAVFAYQG